MNQTLFERASFSIGNKVLIMMSAFPFFIVGTLITVEPNTLHVRTEFGVPGPLKNQEFAIQFEHISAFYAEINQGEIPVVW